MKQPIYLKLGSIEIDKKLIGLNQNTYIVKILRRFNMHDSMIRTYAIWLMYIK